MRQFTGECFEHELDKSIFEARREATPRCAQSVPRRATTSREAVDAATHLGLITWTYRPQGNPTRPCGCFAAAFTHQRSAVRYRPRPPLSSQFNRHIRSNPATPVCRQRANDFMRCLARKVFISLVGGTGVFTLAEGGQEFDQHRRYHPVVRLPRRRRWVRRVPRWAATTRAATDVEH